MLVRATNVGKLPRFSLMGRRACAGTVDNLGGLVFGMGLMWKSLRNVKSKLESSD